MLKTVSSITNALGALNYKGTWNASTNSPTLASGVGTKGDYYVVSVAGSTTIDGISTWGIGDWIAFNGAAWQRVDGGSDGEFVNLTATGNVNLSGGTFVFNDGGADLDARFEGDTDPNLLFTDASTDRVGVGTGAPLEKFHAAGNATFGTSVSTRPNRYTAFDTLSKTSIAAGATAVIDIVANNNSANGFSAAVAEVDLAVAWEGSPQTLQAHLKYGYITVNNSTGGGTAAITEMFNGSAGAFTVATTDFVVSRPSARTIRITYTSTAGGPVLLAALVKGWSIASVSIS